MSPQVLTQALTHKSFRHGKAPSNERLQYVGRRSLEFFALEANMSKKNVEELKKAVVNISEQTHLAAKFDALGLEAGVQCHLVKFSESILTCQILTSFILIAFKCHFTFR